MTNPEQYVQPQLMAYINGLYIPASEVELEATAYGSTDSGTSKTFFAGLSDFLGGTSLFQMSQKVIPCPVSLMARDNSSPSAEPIQLWTGLLDEMEANLDEDEVEVRYRGIVALLTDQKTTVKLPQNQDIGDAIASLITKYGLTPQVGKAGVLVGKVVGTTQTTDYYIAQGRNVAVFDLIRTLADFVGWTIRVQGNVVVVGPPPQRGSVPEITRTWGDPNLGGTRCRITHSALHSHNVHVKVISYLPRTKSRTKSSQTVTDLTVAGLLGFPPPQKTSRKTKKSGGYGSTGGQQTGTSKTGKGFSQSEDYIFHIPGLTQAQCDAKAAQIAAEISRHEFILDFTFAPSPAEMAKIAAAGCEWTLNFNGVEDPVFNQIYYPRKVAWKWNVDDGVEINVLAVNHELPEDATATGTF